MRQPYNRGVIEILVIIVLAIVTLSYFNVDLKKLTNEPITQEQIDSATDQGISFFKTHLEKPLTEAWHEITVDGGLWDIFVSSMKQTNQQPQPVQQIQTVPQPQITPIQ